MFGGTPHYYGIRSGRAGCSSKLLVFLEEDGYFITLTARGSALAHAGRGRSGKPLAGLHVQIQRKAFHENLAI